MNRTDRLLALVLELRTRGTARAQDLARTFGTSKRTIYRDIQALSEAGVPVVSVMGEGYRLAEGYFLPPLAFSEDEATLLLLGLGVIADSFDRDYAAAAASARRKIIGVLSDSTRAHAARMQNTLMLGNPQRMQPSELESLRMLRRAILTTRTVRFRYFSRHPGDGRVSLREADPYSLFCMNNTWFMTAYCHLRQDRRMFRLSRMEALTVTAQTFDRPADYVITDDRQVLVRLLFSEDVQLWINEDNFYYIDRREPHPDGTLVTLRVRHSDEVVQWVLGWGRHVRVLEPDSLRERLLEEAEGLRQNHQPHE